MTAYNYYGWEDKEYSDLYNISVSSKEAPKLLNKLKRHFKFSPEIKVCSSSRFHARRAQAFYGNLRSVVKLGQESSLGVIAHEFAHLLAREARGAKGYIHHDKVFRRQHKRVANYIRCRNYFKRLEKLIVCSHELLQSNSAKTERLL